MTRLVAIRTMVRHTPDGRTNDQDLVAIEAPVSLHVLSHAGTWRDLGLLMRTPGHDEDLAVGVLAAEGVIRSAADVVHIESVASDDQGDVIRVTVGPDADVQAVSDRVGSATSACGLCGRLSLRKIDRFGASSGDQAMRVPANQIQSLPDRLRERQDAFAQTGGLHAAGVFTTEGELVELREDVGRHNAVDKVVGALLRRNALPAHGMILTVSGRVAFEIVQKAAMAGLPMVVAVGAPTDMAIDAARACGITLVGFTRGGRFNIYTFAERITNQVDATRTEG